jgi:molybdopterin synthase catalytic subunit
MQIEIQLTTRRIAPERGLPKDLAGAVGAVAEFSGVVRVREGEATIAALEYEAYPAMARRVMHGILEELGRRHSCLLVRVTHRLGIIPVGETALRVVVLAGHRGEAFAMLREFMDRLKQDVPIWKRRAVGPGPATERPQP